MKVNRIITATLLSAGLIVGTSSAVHAAGPTSVATPTVTMPTYQTQLVAYKRVLSTYASVVAAFKVQVVVFGNAVQTYKASYGVSLDAYKAVIKANFPGTNTAKNPVLLAASNTAITTAVQNYDALVTKREDLRKAIDVAFETAIQNANAVFATASTIATTADQKLAATNARQSAVDLAKTVRKARLHAVGAKPVRPIKRMKFNNRIKNFNADKPVRPVKPAKATNANKH
jgi:hypothetical protein